MARIIIKTVKETHECKGEMTLTLTLEQKIVKTFEQAEWYGWTEANAPEPKYFRKGKGKKASLYAVPDWNRRANTSVSVMFKGLYGDYWFEWAEVTTMKQMQELSEDEMRKIAPGLVNETKLLALGDEDSYMRLVLEAVGKFAQALGQR